MEFTSKELLLMSSLSAYHSPLPAGELSEILEVSTKTIYRMMKRINKIAGEEVLVSYTGKGISLNYDSYLKINHQSYQHSDAEKRRFEILLKLLYLSPKTVDIDYLFQSYYLSEAVVINDIGKMYDVLTNYNLILNKKSSRLSISGEEISIRSAIDDINQKLGIYKQIFLENNNRRNSSDVDYVTRLFKKMEGKIGAHLNYPYNVNIFSHLYILIQRGRHGFINGNIIKEDFTTDERMLIDKNRQLYSVAEETINSIRNYLNITISTFENFYLFFHLLSSRFDQKEFLEDEKDGLIKQIASQLLEVIGLAFDVKLINPETISDLITHLRALTYRLTKRFVVKNELLEEIKLEYPEEFMIVGQKTSEILESYGYVGLSDDEIGFLTLYFVKYKVEMERPKRILIMCSSGVGTSELLKTRVLKSIPDIEIVDVLSVHLYEKKKNNYKNIDLILTTVNYNEFDAIPSILVSVLFNERDANRVRSFLGGNKYEE
ncbi:putative transcription antiterminator BglG family protein [Streptococcus varani]|uniref:Putative transcription antiterminator BglG family protein n=2 Tax=Streptococcus varani TaxID=1608583 RepID=A0A0E4H6F2_9STRE|nr:putative transcription antiterminator BglG family protein [Streptococcus varani]